MRNIRPRITKEEYSIIQKIREDHSALNQECEEKGIPIEKVSHYWYKGDNFSINVKAPAPSYDDVREAVVSEMKKHSPDYKEIKRSKQKDTHLLVIDPADIHIGKLATKYETGEDYNVDIAVERVLEGVNKLLEKCIGFNFDKIMYVIGNDILHRSCDCAECNHSEASSGIRSGVMSPAPPASSRSCANLSTPY